MFLPASVRTLLISGNCVTPPDIISPSTNDTEPSFKILNVILSKDAAIFCILPSSIVELAKSKTKKQSNKFIRSLKVAIHAGEPSSGGCCFLLAIAYAPSSPNAFLSFGARNDLSFSSITLGFSPA